MTIAPRPNLDVTKYVYCHVRVTMHGMSNISRILQLASTLTGCAEIHQVHATRMCTKGSHEIVFLVFFFPRLVVRLSFLQA